MIIIGCGDGNGSGSNTLTGNAILPPTKSGQIPVAVVDDATGTRIYAPSTNRILPQALAADVGKGVFVQAVDTDGNVTYEFKPAVIVDSGTKSLINQTGVYGINSNMPSVTKKDDTTISVGAFNASFYNKVSDVLTKVNFPAQDIAITASTDPLNTSNTTWIKANPDGTYSQTNTRPIDEVNNIYIAKVFHPGGGLIRNVDGGYQTLDQPQTLLRITSDALGMFEKDFNFTYNAPTNDITQNSSTARLTGYNINPAGGVLPAFDPMTVTFPTGTITFEYYSYDSANIVSTTTTLARTYKIDNPATNTSTAMTNNTFAIILLFASADSEYLMLAPQKQYATAVAAKADLSFYLSSVRKPEFLVQNYSMVGIGIIPNTVAANTVVEFVSYNGQNVGGAPVSGASVPALPGPAGRVVSDGSQYTIQTTAAESVVTTGATNGQIATIQGNNVVFVNPTPGVISTASISIFGNNFEVIEGTILGNVITITKGNTARKISISNNRIGVTSDSSEKILFLDGIVSNSLGQFSLISTDLISVSADFYAIIPAEASNGTASETWLFHIEFFNNVQVI